MDIAVVDDEKAIREHICALIEVQKPKSSIEAYATGEALLASGKCFDIVFLDIQKGNLLILKVENSFDGRLVIRSQDEFPITDKADKKSHGVGLANIKNTAKKYQGTMDFKIKDRVFILSVMMKNEIEDELLSNR